MNIKIITKHPTNGGTISEPYNNLEEVHILTVGESGFSMLNFYAERYKLKSNVIRAFADQINLNDESGSLFPKAPISAVPRKFFRDYQHPNLEIIEDFKRHLCQFIEANNQTIKSKKILIDFHVSDAPVPAEYMEATIEIFQNNAKSSCIEEILLVR